MNLGKLLLCRVSRYGAAGILGLVVGLAIAALTPRKWGELPPSGHCEFPIYVSGDRMHAELIVPVRTPIFDWNTVLNLNQIGRTPASQYRYLQFGWGDRIFYMQTPSWEQMNWASALRSLFYWRNSSAVFVKGHATLPTYPSTSRQCVRLGRTDYLALMQFLQNSFQRDSQGQLQHLGLGQDGDSSFYAATGYYSVLRTCNSWTAEALQAAQVNTPVWTALAPPILHHLRNGCQCDEP